MLASLIIASNVYDLIFEFLAHNGEGKIVEWWVTFLKI